MDAIFTAFAVGLVYVGIWGIYRIVRWREHKRYRQQHAAERSYRARFERDFDLPDDERLRRAKWDAEFGPLLGALDLKNREESRWPLGGALQGAAAVTASVLIGLLIWQTRVPHGAGRADNGGTSWGESGPYSGSNDQPNPSGDVTNGGSQLLKPASAGELACALLFCSALVGSGTLLIYNAPTRAVRAAGYTLAATGSILGGAKLLSIDRLISAKTLLSVQVTRYEQSKQRIDPPRVSFAVRLPPFTTGSARPDRELQCAIETLASAVAADRKIESVIVVGRADKRNLNGTTRAAYATNWGLAQQRAEAITGALVAAGVEHAKIATTSAGPTLTSLKASDDSLAADRAATVVVYAAAGDHSWSRKIKSSGEWGGCSSSRAVHSLTSR